MMVLNQLHAYTVRAFDRFVVRSMFRALGFCLLAFVLFSALGRGAEHATGEHASEAAISGEHERAAPPADAVEAGAVRAPAQEREEARVPTVPELPVGLPPKEPEARMAYFLAVARFHAYMGDRTAAERAFAQALHEDTPIAAKRDVMLDLERFYREGGDLMKAVAVLEKFRLACPTDPDLPAVLMRLGLAYREMGAMDQATARFYQVLNSTLSIRPEELDEYRTMAMKARLEISEIYLLQGKLDEAGKLYSRLQVLDLDPADRERVAFRGAQLQHAIKQWKPAINQLGAFVREYPNGAFAAEAHYLRAKALDEVGRKEEAVQEVIELLDSPMPEDGVAAQTVAYWKRRTANELANIYFEAGDFHGALAIYQALARAGAEPTWRWPAVYQVGLCFERLALPERAAEAYRLILSPEAAPKDGEKVPESLVSLKSMAKWRLDHLDWVEDFGQRIQGLTADHPAGS